MEGGASKPGGRDGAADVVEDVVAAPSKPGGALSRRRRRGLRDAGSEDSSRDAEGPRRGGEREELRVCVEAQPVLDGSSALFDRGEKKGAALAVADPIPFPLTLEALEDATGKELGSALPGERCKSAPSLPGSGDPGGVREVARMGE